MTKCVIQTNSSELFWSVVHIFIEDATLRPSWPHIHQKAPGSPICISPPQGPARRGNYSYPGTHTPPSPGDKDAIYLTEQDWTHLNFMMCIHGINLHRRNRDVLNMPQLWGFFFYSIGTWVWAMLHCACSKKWKDTGSVLCVACVLTLSRKRCLCAAVSGYCRSACRVELSFWKCSCMIWPKGSCGWICSYITKRDCGRSFAAQPMMASDLKDTQHPTALNVICFDHKFSVFATYCHHLTSVTRPSVCKFISSSHFIHYCTIVFPCRWAPLQKESG